MSKKSKQVREMDLSLLNSKLFELRTQLTKDKAIVSSGTKPENPGVIRRTRRDIARILTILKEKEWRT